MEGKICGRWEAPVHEKGVNGSGVLLNSLGMHVPTCFGGAASEKSLDIEADQGDPLGAQTQPQAWFNLVGAAKL